MLTVVLPLLLVLYRFVYWMLLHCAPLLKLHPNADSHPVAKSARMCSLGSAKCVLFYTFLSECGLVWFNAAGLLP